MTSRFEQKLSIIHNALGLLYAKKPYRNHYCAGGPSIELCDELVADGLMERGDIVPRRGGSDGRWFYVTEKGARSIGHSLPKD